MSNRYRIAFKEVFCGIRIQSNNSLVRNSTFRETRQISHSDSQRIIEPSTPPTYVSLCQVTENGNDTVRYYNNDLLTVKNKNNGNTIIYQIAIKPKLSEITCLTTSTETCI